MEYGGKNMDMSKQLKQVKEKDSHIARMTRKATVEDTTVNGEDI